MPLGYTTYYAGSFEDLATERTQVQSQEEASPEGALVLLELNLVESPQSEAILELNRQLLNLGVSPWPGYRDIAFADAAQPKVYVCWIKGIAWTPIIIGILITLLPAIIGGALWLLVPQPIKDMITMMGLMMVMLPIMGMVTKEK